MQTERKNQLIELYGILLTDCICVILSYLLALLLRYGTLAIGEADHPGTYLLACVWILLFTVSTCIIVTTGRLVLILKYCFRQCSSYCLEKEQNK